LPNTQANDFFWTQSARKVFKGILIYLMHQSERMGERATNWELVTFLNSYASEPAVLWKELKKDTAAAAFASTLAGAEKRSPSNVPTSTMATLTAYTHSFTRPEVAEKGWFSIRDWLKDPNTEGQAIFLMNPARYEDNYKSYFTVILDLALKEMISLPNDNDRRVWFFVDEFGSLFKLGSVVRLLAEGRAKGACTILGTQDMSQIRQQYDKETETIINNCNNKIIARVTSYDEADYLSKNIGQAEIEQSGETSSLSFDDRQGYQTSLQERKGEKRRELRNVTLPSEIMELQNLTYFVKFAEHDWFKNRIDYYPWTNHELIPAFLPRPNYWFDTSRVILPKYDDDDDFFM
jgi:type IV secretory pathway TraG/TraD family ATPase VirD4